VEPITEQGYWAEIRSIVDEIVSEVKQAEPDGDADSWRESADERLWETVDGHQWVIYTYYHYQVLQISPNDGYSIENFGSEGLVENGSLDTAKLTFGALYADCMERLADVEWDTEETDAA